MLVYTADVTGPFAATILSLARATSTAGMLNTITLMV